MRFVLFLSVYIVGLNLGLILPFVLLRRRGLRVTMLYLLPVAVLTAAAGWMAPLPAGGVLVGGLIGYAILSFQLTWGWRILFGVGAAGLFLFLELGLPALSRVRDKAILEKGIEATATVLEVIDTNRTVNDNPQVIFRLLVKPPQGAPYEARIEKLVSRLSAPAALSGTTLNVKYDPKNPSRVVFDED